jgi:hemerythrin-like domain-containing protein
MSDIIEYALMDHESIRKPLETLKSETSEFSEKLEAFRKFAPMLLTHAKSEEQALYETMLENDELKEEGYEGKEEHKVAEQLINELLILGIDNEELWMAKAKVLAEVVEHHLDEEEQEIFPDIQEQLSSDRLEEIGEIYLDLRKKIAGQLTQSGIQSLTDQKDKSKDSQPLAS